MIHMIMFRLIIHRGNISDENRFRMALEFNETLIVSHNSLMCNRITYIHTNSIKSVETLLKLPSNELDC